MINKSNLEDCADIANALHAWFDNQEIASAMRVMAMGYLIGAMASASDKDIVSVKNKLKAVGDLAGAIALIGIAEQ